MSDVVSGAGKILTAFFIRPKVRTLSVSPATDFGQAAPTLAVRALQFVAGRRGILSTPDAAQAVCQSARFAFRAQQIYTDAGSFKTPDRYGNPQLTFFMKGDDCVADIDIDDASGLEHFFQVVNNMLPGNDTHPYTIHEILIAYQKLDPGYTFVQ